MDQTLQLLSQRPLYHLDPWENLPKAITEAHDYLNNVLQIC